MMSSRPMDLQVRVMSAFNLHPANIGGRTSDPYATLRVARTKEVHKTSVCLNTVNPSWYETLTFHKLRPSDVIQVTITDSNVVTNDKPIGSAQISVGGALSRATAVASEAAYRASPHPSQVYDNTPAAEPNAPPLEQFDSGIPEMNMSSFEAPVGAGAASYQSTDVPPYQPSSDVPPYRPPVDVPPYQVPPEYASQNAPSTQPYSAYPSYYPTPSDYHPSQPPPVSHQPPPLSDQPPPVYPNVSHHEDYSFEPPQIARVDAEMQRQMTMAYTIAPQGTITLVIAPEWLPNLEQCAPKKGFKRFQIHKVSDQVTKQSFGSALGKFIKSGAEKAKPLQTALHALEPIHAVFQEHSTWKITLLDVDAVFQGKRHRWNEDYPNAQKIFQGPGAVLTRRMVQMQHVYLYGGGSQLKPVQNMRKELQEVTGNLIDGTDFLQLMEYGIRRGKPRLFTYVIMPNRLYLAETGAKFFRDMASKHAMHCSASPEVVYAGELHFRRAPPGSSEPEFTLIVDNNSGTYAPEKEDLPLVEEVFRRNFPGLHVVALDYQSPLLKQYVNELPPNHSRVSQEAYFSS